MNTLSKELELPGAFVLGAAGAPSRIVGMNAEVSHFYITPPIWTGISSLRVLLSEGCSLAVLSPGVEATDIILHSMQNDDLLKQWPKKNKNWYQNVR